MSSVFDQYMAKANPHFLATFGREISYTPKGGQPQTITAIVGDVEADISDDELGEMEVRFRPVSVSLLEITAPQIGDIATIDSEVWLVTKLIGISSGFADLRVRWTKDMSKRHEMQKKKIEV